MDYVEHRFEITPLLPARDILVAELAELGFESFVEEDFGLLAYIPAVAGETIQTDELMSFNLEHQQIKHTFKTVPRENWNAKWEADFEPIFVDDRILVRAPFHEENQSFEHVLTIQPKMSFGTGHHDTTWLMMKTMLDIDLHDKDVLDMGSGTGILAILAELLGARSIDAIDIDDWAAVNAEENAALNGCSRIQCYTGDAALLGHQRYHLVLANINRNVLMADLPKFAEVTTAGGSLLLSGFFPSDAAQLTAKAESLGYRPTGRMERNDWCCLRFEKASD